VRGFENFQFPEDEKQYIQQQLKCWLKDEIACPFDGEEDCETVCSVIFPKFKMTRMCPFKYHEEAELKRVAKYLISL